MLVRKTVDSNARRRNQRTPVRALLTMTAESERKAGAAHRWPAVIGLLIALVLFATLPTTFLPNVRLAVVIIGLGLMVPLVALNPRRLTRETRWSRYLSVGQALLLVIANETALVQLVVVLTNSAHSNGPTLLLAALQVWVTNVIAFALVYWELDRGGPVLRRHSPRHQLPRADFRFPQDEDHDAVKEVAARSSVKTGWTASFIDYVYFSLSNSMAFSPTDTMLGLPLVFGCNASAPSRRYGRTHVSSRRGEDNPASAA